jgi:CheY-like chemotaxis protein
MSLQTLILCSDDKILRVLRRVLSDLEIAVEFCSDADSAVRKLSRRRFEAVVVDCNDEDMAAQALKSVRSAPCNKRSIAVAMIDGQKAVRSAFALGAHFVLYKPISAERARTSFRAARALMKCERRRNTRVAVQIPVVLIIANGAGQRKAISSDLSQGGMSLKLARRAEDSGPVHIKFTLPGTDDRVECTAEMAWQGEGAQAGLRFVNLSPEKRDQLRSWLGRHSPEMEPDDPPAPCKLTDLTSGACYLEMASPFPVNTRVILILRLAKLDIRAEGVVRVMHPEIGMGVQFTRDTNQQRKHLEKFIQAFKSDSKIQPDLVVEPEGMNDAEPGGAEPPLGNEIDEIADPLLELFHRSINLTHEDFLSELRSQRNSPPATARSEAASV